MANRAVFLDRDGVLNEPAMRNGVVSAPFSVEELKWIPEAKEAVEKLASRHFLLFVFSNQPDVARGNLKMETLLKMNEKLLEHLGGNKVIQGVFICPHDKEDDCMCRKPKPGMILAAGQKWDVDLERSFVVGDRRVDILAGKEAGCKTVLIDMPYNQEVDADYRAKNILDATEWILNQTRGK